MDKKLLLDIIDNGINEIKSISSSFILNDPSEKDIDIAIKKTEIILKELNILLESKTIDTKSDIIASPINKEHEDIRSLIGINDKFLFIRELFNGDSQLYNEELERINKTNSLSEAIQINSTYNWNKDEESTKLFIEILNRKFI